jgi:DNA gyrase/topoisomerase IV subunit A
LLIFFISCSKNTNTNENKTVKTENNTTLKKTEVKKVKNEKPKDIVIIKLNDFQLEFNKTKLIYPKEKTVILFDNNNTYSKAQESVLQKLNVKYYKTNSPYLEKYFNIEYYPTIVVLDKNKTVKYENFTPYEILKAEGF